MATLPTTTILSSHLAVASRFQGPDWYPALTAPSLSLVPRYLPVTLLDTTLPSLLATLAPAGPADWPSPRSSVMQRGGRTQVKCAGQHPTEEKTRILGHFAHSRIPTFTHSPNPPIHPSIYLSNQSIIRPFISLPHLSFRVREYVRVREVMHAMRMQDKRPKDGDGAVRKNKQTLCQDGELSTKARRNEGNEPLPFWLT